MFSAIVLTALLAQASTGCACLCIDGAARTVCNDLPDAQAKPTLCMSGGVRRSCPLPAGEFTPERFTAPSPGATDCREARIWDPDSGRYDRLVRVCETTSE
jgi:hypothetical protein